MCFIFGRAIFHFLSVVRPLSRKIGEEDPSPIFPEGRWGLYTGKPVNFSGFESREENKRDQ